LRERSDSERRRRVPARGELILGLDIGGTKTAVVVGTRDGQVRERWAFPSAAARGFEPMWQEIAAAAERALAQEPAIGAIGVSIGGPMDPFAGVILSPPHLPGWDQIPLRRMLEERFSLPAWVEHDAKTGALAEWMFGAGRGARDMVFLTAGTGLGGGVIAGGRLLRGAASAAGECGHWRIAGDGPLMFGKRGSWESYASGAGIAALARERFPDRFAAVSAAEVAERARAGDGDARAVLAESAAALGRGLALLVDLLAPEVIVLGTLARHMHDIWLEPAIAVMQGEALAGHAARCRVVPSELGDALGDVATLCAVIYREREEVP
jgi:glucokinase